MEPTLTIDELWMRRAISLARRALGSTRPNPAVGCVIVRDGLVLAEGFTAPAGGPHAEAAALAACSEDPRGATLYVTLEPCNHTGRTPPCTEAILRAGVTRVIIGARDPNALAGGGAERLRSAGIDVTVGVLQRDCWLLNPGFHTFHAERRTLVTLKWAMSADGCTSSSSGDSKWISSAESRRFVHQLRAEHDAILVGSVTVQIDQARLTVRDVPGAELGPPRRRMVLDTALSIGPEHALFVETQGLPTVVCGMQASSDLEQRLREVGAEVWRMPLDRDGRVSLPGVLERLHDEGRHSLLVEGGRRVAGSFLNAGLVDRVYAFVAPMLIGGGEGHLGALIHDHAPKSMDTAHLLGHAEWSLIGTDAMLSGWLKDPFDS